MENQVKVESKRLARATSLYNHVPQIVPGLKTDLANTDRLPFHESVRLCRYFYRRDGIASTVVNRMAEIVNTALRNRSLGARKETELEVFNVVAAKIQPYIKQIARSYLIDGMAVPQFEVAKVMGNRVSQKLGRTRYIIPDRIWLRNPENIVIKRIMVGGKRRAYIRIPREDIYFIQNNGKWPDGTSDVEEYRRIAEEMPEYVAAIKGGKITFTMDDFIIYRNLLPSDDYPIPFLESALNALDHKRYLKMMDRSIATRAIEAFRHIRVGSDEYPADDEDITATENAMTQQSSVDRVYNLYTNHTIDITWVIPPLDVLMDETKYIEANADIFFALGFPRILTVGETEKSNAADNKIAALGIVATLRSIQDDILQWVRYMYDKVAEENGFTEIPEPYFSPILLADVTQLIQYARDMIELGVISKNTAASFYGTDYDTERTQRSYEDETKLEFEIPLETGANEPTTNPITQQNTQQSSPSGQN